MMPLSATSFLRRFTVSVSGYALLTRTMPSSLSARGLAMLYSRSPAIKAAGTVANIRVVIRILPLSALLISAPGENHHREQDVARCPRDRVVALSIAPSDESVRTN